MTFKFFHVQQSMKAGVRRGFCFMGLLVAILPQRSLAQSDSNSGQAPVGPAIRGKHGKAHNDAKTTQDPLKIRGQCIVIASDLNPMGGPCNSIVLILNDESNKEILRTRTDKQGLFEFAPTDNQKGPFFIVSGAKFYENTKPKATVIPGQSIELQLRMN